MLKIPSKSFESPNFACNFYEYLKNLKVLRLVTRHYYTWAVNHHIIGSSSFPIFPHQLDLLQSHLRHQNLFDINDGFKVCAKRIRLASAPTSRDRRPTDVSPVRAVVGELKSPHQPLAERATKSHSNKKLGFSTAQCRYNMPCTPPA